MWRSSRRRWTPVTRPWSQSRPSLISSGSAGRRRTSRDQKIELDEIGKGDQLVDGSPVNRAGDIHAPVLLVHGTLDGNVSYNHSKRMLAALKRAGASADLLTFDGLDHQLDDSNARTEMLTQIGELLDRTIGH